MLSIESTCKASALKSDERPDGDELAFQEADLVNLDEIQATNFSIRDYVFSSRSKDIKKNWPFSQHPLDLCLNHNVKDLLPPFEPVGLITSQCCRKIVECQQLVTCSGVEQISTDFKALEITEVGQLHAEPDDFKAEISLSADQLVEECSNHTLHPLLEKENLKVGERDISDDDVENGVTEAISEATIHDKKESNSGPTSGTPSVIKFAEPPPVVETSDISRKPSAKKCKLIVRFGSTSGIRRPEDIASTSSTVSDSMASKLCPVCRTFTSTSNTTLNAHIDQCLSTESNDKLVETQSLTFKVKPRKKRLMEDIYVTAMHCTLEDLDRRNGTNWATDLALVASSEEVYTEIKRPKLSKLSPLDNMDDVNEGAVYVDSNGTKLRILSRFNDTPPLGHLKLGKKTKGSKVGSKSLHFKEQYSKNMKLKPPKKKVHVITRSKEETQETTNGDDLDSTNRKEESLSQILLTQDHSRSSEPATLKEWVCSKRSGISKKLTKNGIGKCSSNKTLMAKDPSSEKNKPDSRGCSAARSYIPTPKFSRSPENLVSPLKTKSVQLPPKTAHTKIKKNKTLKPANLKSRSSSHSSSVASGLKLKLSRSLGNSGVSPEIRREEIDVGITQKSNINCCSSEGHSESRRQPMEADTGSTLKKNALLGGSSFEVEKSNEANNCLTSKKIRKHRSLLGNDVLHRNMCVFADTSYDFARANETSKVLQFNLSDDVASAEAPVIQNQMPESEQGKEYLGTVKRQKCNLKKMQKGGEFHGTGKQAEATICADTLNRHSMGHIAADLDTSVTMISERFTSGSNANSDGAETLAGWSSYSHELENPQGDECGNKLISQSIQREGFVEYGVGNCTVQHAECQTDSAPAENSNPHFTNADRVLNIHRQKAPMTLMGNISELEHDLAPGRDQSGSPVSTVSTMSHPSPEGSILKDPEEDMPVRYSVGDDKRSLLSSSALPLSANTAASEGTKSTRRNQEFKVIAPAKQHERFMDGQSCCCSCKETLSRESQLLRQSFMAGTSFPSWEKQTSSNMYIRPTISSSLSASPSSRLDDMAIPIMESYMGSSYHPAKLQGTSDSSSGSPFSRVPIHAASNPILRLMGKNLVVNKEDCTEELPNVLPFYSNYIPNGSFASNQSSFSFHFHHVSGSAARTGQAPSGANSQLPYDIQNNHLMPMLHQQPHWKRLKMKPSGSMQQVIVIDDSAKHGSTQKRRIVSPAVTSPLPVPSPNFAPQRPLPCFPSQNPFLAGEMLSFVSKPSFPAISQPRVNGGSRKQGNNSEGLCPLLPNSYPLPSLSSGQPMSSKYCPPAFR